MTVKIFNSLTRQKEDFVPISPPVVKFYACGPTVYDKFHIGNARTFVNTDVVRRWLLQRGFDVQFAMNITDVDDKIIKKANEEGVTSEEIAARYTDYFLSMIGKLGNLPATHHPRATQHIGTMIGMIKKLIDRGHAYPSGDGSVWFEVSTFKEYGKLSRMPLDQMQQGERVDQEQQKLKRSPLDFALWKGAKPGEPAWKSPWGEGRPGWHIECSCMSIQTLKGDTLDIHSGGSDLRFPHHENEIAQSECSTGRTFANYWIHIGMLDIDGEKMSKSLGNMKFIDEVMTVIDPLTLRYFLMSARYRDKIDYTDDNVHKCRSAVERLLNATAEARRVLKGQAPAADWAQEPDLAALWAEFGDGMDDDFNTPRALAALSQLVTLLNTLRVEAESGGASIRLARALGLLGHMREALGLTASLEKQDTGLDDATLTGLRALAAELGAGTDGPGDEIVKSLIAARAAAKKAKDYKLADSIRTRLTGIGIVLEDRPGETLWKKG